MTEWLLIPLGFFVGAIGTIIGAGGGFLLVPALLFLYPTAKPSTVTSVSLAVVFFNALAGSLAYGRERRIDYRSGWKFAVATIPGAVVGAVLIAYIPRGPFAALFGILLVVLGLVTLRRPRLKPPGVTLTVKPGLTMRTLVDATGERYEWHFSERQGIALSVGIGFLSSLLGIGGGIIYVPAMVFLFDFPTHVATATSQFILVFMSLAGTGVHLLSGELAFGSGLGRSLFVAAGAVPGAVVGARLSRHLRGSIIIRLLAAALIVVGLRLTLEIFNL